MNTFKCNFRTFLIGYTFIFASLVPLTSIALPPDYDFRNPILIAGTNLQLNSRYRFSNVKPGVDAIVTIMAFSGGVTLNQMDGPTGYVEALQPVIYAPANSNGYVELRIQFVTAGGSAGLTMPQIASTSLDIDGTLSGSGDLFEYDMVSLNSAASAYNYDMTTPELTLSSTGVGGWVTGRNVTGANYNGVDTSARRVMFTVINYNTTSYRVRVGTENRNTSGTTRNKSIYFANFVYNGGLLTKSPLTGFTGTSNNDKVSLAWQVENPAAIEKIFVERSNAVDEFHTIQHHTFGSASTKTNFQLTDYIGAYDKVYYRLKIVDVHGAVNYSKIITFSPVHHSAFSIRAYFEGAAAAPTIIVNSPVETHGKLVLIDLSGNIQLSREVTIHPGKNYIRTNTSMVLKPGYHVAVLQIGKDVYASKFMGMTL